MPRSPAHSKPGRLGAIFSWRPGKDAVTSASKSHIRKGGLHCGPPFSCHALIGSGVASTGPVDFFSRHVIASLAIAHRTGRRAEEKALHDPTVPGLPAFVLFIER